MYGAFAVAAVHVAGIVWVVVAAADNIPSPHYRAYKCVLCLGETELVDRDLAKGHGRR